MSRPVQNLRTVVQEGIRVQKGGSDPIEYVDVSHALHDIVARQNHVIFGRRGCGKTLLLDSAGKHLQPNTAVVYINCEDYKQHSFPNVLIEILDRIFLELERNLKGWFGRKKKSRELIQEIRRELNELKEKADEQDTKIKETASNESSDKGLLKLEYKAMQLGTESVAAQKAAIEKEYAQHDSKLHKLNLLLPKLKQQIRDFFELSNDVKAIFVELDDFYQLARTMQPHVADYVHRLCKDIPLYFKFATLRHASTLYADRKGQPTGAQERHDYQPINVDFTLAEYGRTADQLLRILYKFGEKAEMTTKEIDNLFMGEGFSRLVLASGGVPRDFLSLLLEGLSSKKLGEEKIGKDDVRLLSLAVFQRRIEELKADSEEKDQQGLLRGIYAIRKFVTEKKVNVFLVPDRVLQEQNGVRDLLNRLLDYRIVHLVGTALTHKNTPGTFTAYMIDIGAYANLRKLQDRFMEIDITAKDARERCRNAPILDEQILIQLYRSAPEHVEEELKAGTVGEGEGSLA
jgi:Cdc6-like AAA superfamily ATPase